MAVKRRLPIPEELANAPRLYPWLSLFQQAFWDLCSDRHSPDAAIPWTARQKWAEVHGLDETATQLLHTHVKQQDIAFMQHLRQNAPKSEGGGKIGAGRGDDGAAGDESQSTRRSRRAARA